MRSALEQRKGARRRGRPPLSLDGDNPEARARISEAAIELFSIKGFHGTGVAEIGALANLGSGALYYHIGSKEDLLWEILRVHVDEALAAAKKVSASNLRPEEKLRQLVQEHVRIIADRRREVAIYMRDGKFLTGESGVRLQSLRDQVEAVWRNVLLEGVREGTFRQADNVAVNAILGMVNTVYMWFKPRKDSSYRDVADGLFKIISRGIIV